jgi:hypothetical protein
LKGVLAAFNITLPDDLLQFIDNHYMFGIVHGKPNEMFLVLKTNYFESAAYSLNQHENNVAGALFPLLTSSLPPAGFLTIPFKDKVVRNIDARLMHDASGKTVFIYGFVDRNTVIMTTSEEAFSAIVDVYNTPAGASQ